MVEPDGTYRYIISHPDDFPVDIYCGLCNKDIHCDKWYDADMHAQKFHLKDGVKYIVNTYMSVEADEIDRMRDEWREKYKPKQTYDNMDEMI